MLYPGILFSSELVSSFWKIPSTAPVNSAITSSTETLKPSTSDLDASEIKCDKIGLKYVDKQFFAMVVMHW